MLGKLVVLVAALLAPTETSTDQFDLVCTGTAESATSRAEPISRRYHVDLTANRWCANECTIRPLVEVTSAQIVFEEVKAAFRHDPSEKLDYVNRTTGKWAFFTLYWQGDGTCERASFTGFPEKPTKF